MTANNSKNMCIVVGGMPYDLTETRMIQFCSHYGKVLNVVLKQKTLQEATESRPDIETPKAHSYAFVTFSTHHEAFTAHKMIPSSVKGKKHQMVTNWSFKEYYKPSSGKAKNDTTRRGLSKRQKRIKSRPDLSMSLSKLVPKPAVSNEPKSGTTMEKHHHTITYHKEPGTMDLNTSCSNNKCIVVGGMSYDISKEQMTHFCNQYGIVLNVVIKRKTLQEATESRPDIEGSKAHSYAFVTYSTHHEALTAYKLIPISYIYRTKYQLTTKWSFQ